MKTRKRKSGIRETRERERERERVREREREERERERGRERERERESERERDNGRDRFIGSPGVLHPPPPRGRGSHTNTSWGPSVCK